MLLPAGRWQLLPAFPEIPSHRNDGEVFIIHVYNLKFVTFDFFYTLLDGGSIQFQFGTG